MIPKRAIELAIEGGWREEDFAHFRTRMVRPDEKIIVHVSEWNGMWYADFAGAQWPLSEIALDPTFWQALGKALGWEKDTKATESYRGKEVLGLGHFGGGEITRLGQWIHYAAGFYDLILTGGDTEKFWNDLLY